MTFFIVFIILAFLTFGFGYLLNKDLKEGDMDLILSDAAYGLAIAFFWYVWCAAILEAISK